MPPLQICHCSQCRRAQGSAFAANLPIRSEDFQLHSGEDLIQSFESVPGKFRCFCKTCGSPLFSRRDNLPGVLRLRVGLLDEPVRTAIGFHAFVGSAAAWWPGPADVPHHDEWAPPT
ncbi:MAG: hypothetical protein RLZZ618_2256 [Pseudomonadota bacterium]